MKHALRFLLPITLLPGTPAFSGDGAAPLWQPTTITQSGSFCSDGATNTSHGDNYMPNEM